MGRFLSQSTLQVFGVACATTRQSAASTLTVPILGFPPKDSHTEIQNG